MKKGNRNEKATKMKIRRNNCKIKKDEMKIQNKIK